MNDINNDGGESRVGYQELYEIILDIMGDRLSVAGFNRETIDPDTNYVASGILDSFGTLDALMEIEERAQLSTDLGQMDFEKAMTIKGLAEEIVRINS